MKHALKPLGLCFFYRVAVACLLAGPVAAAINVTVRHHPAGDAVLFEAGGVWLVEAAMRAQAVLASQLPLAAVVALFMLPPHTR